MATASTWLPPASTRPMASDAPWRVSSPWSTTSRKARWRCTTPKAMHSSPWKATTAGQARQRTSRCRCASRFPPSRSEKHRRRASRMPSDREPPKGCATRPVLRVERGVATPDDDRLAEEVPVAMHFDGEPFAVMMATPTDLEDFARGFALTEGRVGSVTDIERIDVQEVLEGITVNIRTAKTCRSRFSGDGSPPHPSPQGSAGIADEIGSYKGTVGDDEGIAGKAGSHKERLLPGRSGCGICGSRELEDVVR